MEEEIEKEVDNESIVTFQYRCIEDQGYPEKS